MLIIHYNKASWIEIPGKLPNIFVLIIAFDPALFWLKINPQNH